MPLLRLTQHIVKEDQYRVEIALEDDDGSRQTADATFDFQIADQDRIDLRWYLEDYLQYPFDPAPKIAERIEKRMVELGTELFRLVFSNEDTKDLWATFRQKLDDSRVEIVTDVQGATALPWELLRDPKTDVPLALCAKAFVRAYSKAAQKAERAKTAEKVCILLVICRPGGRDDVPFRSVASRLLKGLTGEARERFELTVLRPPTFEQLSRELRDAKTKGQPYHIVHFDGHGAYLKSDPDALAQILAQLGALTFAAPRNGRHGYLLFENPKADQNAELIDGPTLGKLLVEADVPVLVLNACRSAHADIQETPETSIDDTHVQVRAFGSLAQELMDTGVAGVVAMRYNVFVVTAAQFVADLYTALASGQSLGEAVSMGRKQLAAQPMREIAFKPVAMQDWVVPVVYEAAPIQLFPRAGASHDSALHIDLSKTAKAEDNLPRPDVGFFGRDETLLALDRAFDTQKVVLLHAYAGSGKTMTVAEFARWYAQTGGLQGPILFTSFEQYKPLAQVLSAVEETFRPVLEQNNIQWLAMSEEERLNLTLQIFKQIPVLWIWDNMEPINGFPAGTQSAWSEAEQKELKNFLQNITARTKSKFLLTSRRDERAWLGDLPARISLPPMPMQECVQLARALAEKQGRRLTEIEDWMPLLKFTKGNPMTLTVLVGQALRDGLKTKKEIYEYVHKLENGEATFEDEASEGRSKSLGASLSYGFEQAFTEDERKVLALLHFFQGFVGELSLRLMGEFDWSLEEVRSYAHDAQKMINLLDRAAEIGLLTGLGNGYYTIHPALPWFFNSLFEQYYPNELPTKYLQPSIENWRATRAYVESTGALINFIILEYNDDSVASHLRAEEPNLLHARSLARQHDWWTAILEIMQGLHKLYEHDGRQADWRRLVDEIKTNFVDPSTSEPLPGKEEGWIIVTDYCVRLLMEERRWGDAERLQYLVVKKARQRIEASISKPLKQLNDIEKIYIDQLAVALHVFASIQMEQGLPVCVESHFEAFSLQEHIGNKAGAAIIAFNLGHAYKDLSSLQDLDKAEYWYRRSLEMMDENDLLGQSGAINQIGRVLHDKFMKARDGGASEEEWMNLAIEATKMYERSLELAPSHAIENLATSHSNIASIFYDVGDLDDARTHYYEAIRYLETAGDFFRTGLVQCNLSNALIKNGHLSDALLYARAALRNFESYGGRAKEDEDKTKQLIGMIEQAMKEQK
ncbi:MAG: CHAT domain-containing protein [Chloroflexota bacterium]